MDLIVTIDTEEEDLWSGKYRRSGNTVRNVQGVERFQQLCDTYEVRPTYLVDTAVVEDDEASRLLRAIQDRERAEIGAHLHPWCAAPFDEELNEHNSFLCNLPARLQKEKLAGLTDTIEERFERRPTSFRAGRYGLGIEGARMLRELGYIVDSSVIPFTSYAQRGGPDFNAAPHTPYYLDGDDICRSHEKGFLLEVPVSVGYSHTAFKAAHRLRRFAERPPISTLRGVGILDRLGIARRIKFSPEQSNARVMNRLVDVYHRQGAPCIVMLLHSSSLAVGFSPYAKTPAQLERLYTNIQGVLEHCRNRRQMKAKTLTEFAQDRTHALSSLPSPEVVRQQP